MDPANVTLEEEGVIWTLARQDVAGDRLIAIVDRGGIHSCPSVSDRKRPSLWIVFSEAVLDFARGQGSICKRDETFPRN